MTWDTHGMSCGDCSENVAAYSLEARRWKKRFNIGPHTLKLDAYVWLCPVCQSCQAVRGMFTHQLLSLISTAKREHGKEPAMVLLGHYEVERLMAEAHEMKYIFSPTGVTAFMGLLVFQADRKSGVEFGYLI